MFSMFMGDLLLIIKNVFLYNLDLFANDIIDHNFICQKYFFDFNLNLYIQFID